MYGLDCALTSFAHASGKLQHADIKPLLSHQKTILPWSLRSQKRFAVDMRHCTLFSLQRLRVLLHNQGIAMTGNRLGGDDEHEDFYLQQQNMDMTWSRSGVHHMSLYTHERDMYTWR